MKIGIFLWCILVASLHGSADTAGADSPQGRSGTGEIEVVSAPADSVSGAAGVLSADGNTGKPARGSTGGRNRAREAARRFLDGIGRPLRPVSTLLGQSAGIRFALRYRWHLLLIACLLAVIGFAVSFGIRKSEEKRFMTTTRLSIMDKEVQRACRYIEKNHKDPSLTLTRICEKLVTGEAFLESLFERELGISVSAFLLQVRVNRAKILLANEPDMDIAAVAAETGFTDEKKCIDAFQTICGQTPAQFRAGGTARRR